MATRSRSTATSGAPSGGYAAPSPARAGTRAKVTALSLRQRKQAWPARRVAGGARGAGGTRASGTAPRGTDGGTPGARIAVVTAYDHAFARLCDKAGIDVVLVGDSLGMVVQGHPSTLPVTVDEVAYHCRAVARGAGACHVVADMPFMSYQASIEDGVRNAGRLVKEGGAEAVKIEGGVEVALLVQRLVEAGIPVMGHVGLTPQSVHAFGGFKVQGREAARRKAILAGARALADAGAYALVVESVPADLGAEITAEIAIPTIGIGAGVDCDGQVLVLHDLLGLDPDWKPRFARRYGDLGRDAIRALASFATDVRSAAFPGPDESFK